MFSIFQPYSQQPCSGCKAAVTKSRSAHWEGGKGCRDKISMSRLVHVPFFRAFISKDFLMKQDTPGTRSAPVVYLWVIVPHPDLVTAGTRTNHSLISFLQKHLPFVNQAPVVQKVDSAIHWINLYPADNAIGFPITYPLDSDLSDGKCYPAFDHRSLGCIIVLRYIYFIILF